MEKIKLNWNEEKWLLKDPAKQKKFIDITHDGTGRLCTLYYDPETKKNILEPIEEESLGSRLLREIAQKYL